VRQYQRQRTFFLPKYSPDLNLIEQVFAKLKHLLRKAAARTVEAICAAIGEILGTFTSEECANYFKNSGYAQPKTSRFSWHSLLMDRSDHTDAARLTDHALRWTNHQFLKCNLIVSVNCDPMSAPSKMEFYEP
jgi:DDE superfamily endonuclease